MNERLERAAMAVVDHYFNRGTRGDHEASHLLADLFRALPRCGKVISTNPDEGGEVVICTHLRFDCPDHGQPTAPPVAEAPADAPNMFYASRMPT